VAEEARQREGATADASRGFAGEKARPAREVPSWGGLLLSKQKKLEGLLGHRKARLCGSHDFCAMGPDILELSPTVHAMDLCLHIRCEPGQPAQPSILVQTIARS
jgi:hypothetical protein